MSSTTDAEIQEAKEQYESAVESIDLEEWAEMLPAGLVFEETTNPYHAFISDMGIQDGGNGKVDDNYANAYEFAHRLRVQMAVRTARVNVEGGLVGDILESYDESEPNPLTYDHALEVMRIAEDREDLKATDSRKHVYHPETSVVGDQERE